MQKCKTKDKNNRVTRHLQCWLFLQVRTVLIVLTQKLEHQMTNDAEQIKRIISMLCASVSDELENGAPQLLFAQDHTKKEKKKDKKIL
jgi:hypothetical protein